MRVFVGICEKTCIDINCPIARARRDAEIQKRLRVVERVQRKKIEVEQKKLDDQGMTRNLLLRPEDRKDG